MRFDERMKKVQCGEKEAEQGRWALETLQKGFGPIKSKIATLQDEVAAIGSSSGAIKS